MIDDAASLILGDGDCNDILTGERCDPDTLGEALTYVLALGGYTPEEAEGKGDAPVRMRLVFRCTSVEAGRALAVLAAQRAQAVMEAPGEVV